MRRFFLTPCRAYHLLALLAGLLGGITAWAIVPPQPNGTLAQEHILFAPDAKSFVVWQYNKADEIPRESALFQYRTDDIQHIGTFRLPVSEEIFDVGYSPDGRRIALYSVSTLENIPKANWQQIYIWDAVTCEKIETVAIGDWDWNDQIISPFPTQTGELRAFTCDFCNYAIWDVRKRTKIAEYPLPAWCLSDRKNLQIGPGDETVELARHTHQKPMDVLGWQLFGATVSAEGRIAITVPFRMRNFLPLPVYRWNTVTGKKKLLIEIDGMGSIKSVSPNGQYFAAYEENISTPPSLCERINGWVFQRAPAPAGIDFPIRRRVSIFDATSGSLVHRFEGAETILFANNKTLAVLYENRLEIWDLPPRQPQLVIAAIAGGATALVFLVGALLGRLLRRIRTHRLRNPPSATIG